MRKDVQTNTFWVCVMGGGVCVYFAIADVINMLLFCFYEDNFLFRQISK